MTSITSEKRLVKHENAPKKSCFDCFRTKPKIQRKHSRHLTQYEIDYTVMIRGVKTLNHVFQQENLNTEGKFIRVEGKR